MPPVFDSFERHFIGIGIPDCPLTPGMRMESAGEDLSAMRSLFRELGYTPALEHLSAGATSAALRSELGVWLKDRGENDLVAIYYTGHSDVAPGERHYLLTSDYQAGYYEATALGSDSLARMLSGCRAAEVLIMLDTCFAGLGAGTISAMARELIGNYASRLLVVVAASRSQEQANVSVFSTAFAEAVREPRFGGATQPYLFFESLLPGVNARLARPPLQHASYDISSGEREPHLLPNPRYDPSVAPGMDLDAARASTTEAYATHWDPRARGVEFAIQRGWYFTGRVAALRELTQWLAAATVEHPIYVVTGSPGCGKSAVLARLVTLSEPAYRENVPNLQDAAPGTVPEPGSVTVAIHAHGKTVVDVVTEIAAAAGIDSGGRPMTAARLAGAIAKLQRFAIVLDALDESREPSQIARDVILLLTSTGRARILVGSRRRYFDEIAGIARKIDLDHPDYFDDTDLARYAASRLVGTDGSPYAGNLELAATVAEAVARKASPLFLVARLVIESLINAPETIDVTKKGWDETFPSTVFDAFARYLARYGEQQARVESILIPLAYAEGKGLPWEDLWAEVATRIAGRSYGDEDVQWALRQAGPYIVEDLEDGRSVYRLYHEALADYLRDLTKSRAGVIHKRIAQTLIDVTPVENGHIRWNRAKPYTAAHLATHAQEGESLDDLLDDPLFLISADRSRLLRAMAKHAAAIDVQTIVMRMRRPDPADLGTALANLALVALQQGRADLVEKIRALDIRRPWTTLWVTWQSEGPSFLGRLEAKVRSLVSAAIESAPVVMSGDQGGRIGCWYVDSGLAADINIATVSKPATALAYYTAAGRSILLVGDERGTLTRFTIEGRHLKPAMPMTIHDGAISSIHVLERDGARRIVTTAWDGSVKIWNEMFDRPLAQTTLGWSTIYASAIIRHDDRDYLAIGVDFKTVSWAPLSDLSRWVSIPLEGFRALATDGCVLLGSTGFGDVYRIDLRGRTAVPLLQLKKAVSSIAISGSAVATGGGDGNIRLWDLETRTVSAGPFVGHDGAVSALTFHELDDTLTLSSGGEDGTVRIWRASQAAAFTPAPVRRDHSVNFVEFIPASPAPLLIYADDYTAELWDMSDKQLRHTIKSASLILGIATVGGDANRAVVVTKHEVTIVESDTSRLLKRALARVDDCAVYSSPERTLVAARRHLELEVFDTSSGIRSMFRRPVIDGPVRCAFVAHQGRLILGVFESEEFRTHLRLIDVDTRKVVGERRFSIAVAPQAHILVSTGNDLFAVMGDMNQVVAASLERRAEELLHPLAAGPWLPAAFEHGGELYVALGSQKRGLLLRSLEREVITTIPVDAAVHAIAAEGGLIAVGTSKGSAVFDVTASIAPAAASIS